MRLIDGGQQFDIGAGRALRKTMPPVGQNLDLPALAVARDQARHLRPAPARHLLQVTSHQSPRRTAELLVLLLTENRLDPAVNLLGSFAFEPDAGAGFQKRRHRIQVQFLCFVHAASQSSACHWLQAHLVVESHLPFRLILYWIRLRLLLSSDTCIMRARSATT